jgi:serine/threonine-protein kinase
MARIREGTVIADKYRLERPLARGGMGSIWIARHLPLDMPVAVKFMDASFAATADGRTRFEREAKAVALAQSPNIIQIHDYGVHEDLPYMAMELLRGEDLGARIRREGRLSLPVVAGIVSQVCKALRKAHEAGILHRDLKPANIYLTRDDDEQLVKVLDFGVAKMTGVGEAGEATRTGMVVGTVHYMSPEQARGMKDIDHRSDLWSLAVIAFRALTGQLPFPGDQMGDVIVKICTDPVPLVSSYRPDLGPEADAFFARAFARRPDERFQNARELAQAFQALPGAASTADVAYAPLPPAPAMPALLPPPSQPFAPVPAAMMAPPLMVGDHMVTPPIAPIYPPPMAGTLTTSSQTSDVGAPQRPRDASTRTVVLVGVACASVLALGAALVLGRGGDAPRPAASSSAAPAPPAVTVATATAAATTASAAPTADGDSPAASAVPTAVHDAGAPEPAAPTTASAAAPSAPPAKAAGTKTAQPRHPRINSELGF